jgi:hypothetical protein
VSEVLAVLEDPHEADVGTAARSLAGLLGAAARTFEVPHGDPGQRAAAVVAALAPQVLVAVLSVRTPEPVCWDVVRSTTTPVLVLPRVGTGAPASIARVLLPLDGSPGTSAAVAPWARHVRAGGAHLLPMHVFDPDTVPAFWDQAAHSGEHWTEEFLRRNLPDAVDLDLSRGGTPEQVVGTARRDRADMVVLGWGRDLAKGRAATVRHLVERGTVPVLLVPVPRTTSPGPSRRPEGPSALDPAHGGVAR